MHPYVYIERLYRASKSVRIWDKGMKSVRIWGKGIFKFMGMQSYFSLRSINNITYAAQCLAQRLFVDYERMSYNL